MVKLTEVSPTAGLPLQWRDFIGLPFGKFSKHALEIELAKFIGTDHAQIECSGTAALVVALEALKMVNADSTVRKEVVISAYTCPWVALAVIHCGLIPVVADSRPDHFDYCPKALKLACGQQTLAIIHTHLAGRVADVEPSKKIAKEIGAFVIEDAAQSLGATLHGRSVGLHGDIGFYSLGVGKGLTIFAGGVLVSEHPELRNAMQQVSEKLPARPIQEAKRIVELIAYYGLYRPLGMGLAFGYHLRRKLKRGNFIQAVGDDCTFKFPMHRVGRWRKRIGVNALKRLSQFFIDTRLQAERRVGLLAQIKGVKVLLDAPGGQGVWPFIVLVLPTESLRDAVLSQLWHRGLGVGRLFIHAIKDYAYLAPYFQQPNTPNAQDFAARNLIISNSMWLKEKDFLKILDVLSAHLEAEQFANV